MVSSTTPRFSPAVPRPAPAHPRAIGSASTQPSPYEKRPSSIPPLQDGPLIAGLTEASINAVHNFLTTHGASYDEIRQRFPDQTRAMATIWVIFGAQKDGQHKAIHPAFIKNLKSGDWKEIRKVLKNLMFDSVSFSFSLHMNTTVNPNGNRLVLSTGLREVQHSSSTMTAPGALELLPHHRSTVVKSISPLT